VRVAAGVVALVASAFAGASACSTEVAPRAEGDGIGVAHAALASAAPPHLMLMPSSRTHPAPGAPLRKLTYRGGPVISNVKVQAVAWGPNTNAVAKAKLPAWYAGVTNSSYFDWLTEYDTVGTIDGNVGTGQTIGRGSYGGWTTITPLNTATTLSDVDIGGELVNQIASGALPAPELDALGYVNTLYMFEFPPGITLLQGTQTSCVQFCAYHGHTRINGKSVPFSVHPDTSAGGPCAGCSNGGTYFDGVSVVHSHELVEAVTDAAPPSAWWNDTEGEIGDICSTQAADQGAVGAFTVQLEWSNVHGACIASNVCTGAVAPPACQPCAAADCVSPTSVCVTGASDAKYGQCVACQDNTTCSGAAPICERTAGPAYDTCRGCVADSECTSAAAPRCAIGATDSQKGACVACTQDVHCTAPLHCNTATDTCVACTSSSQCANPAPICGAGGTCRACATSAECSGSPRGQACGSGSCVACAEDADCADGTKPVCDTLTHTCVAGTPSQDGGGSGGSSGASGGSDAGGSSSGAAGSAGASDAAADAGGAGGGSPGCAVGAAGATSPFGAGGLFVGLALALCSRRCSATTSAARLVNRRSRSPGAARAPSPP
jgi:hypothetical protein